MKRLFINAALGVALVTLNMACSDFLDIEPKGEAIPQTVDDYAYILNFPDLMKGGETYPLYLTDDVYLPDVADNEMVPGLNVKERYIQRLYTFDKDVFGESVSDALWIAAYQRIFYSNVVINRVMNATHGTDERKRAIRATALAERAFEYLNLVSVYGKHYDPTTAQTDLGVPLITEDDITQTNLKRATVAQIYDLAEDDLKTAVNDLPYKAVPNVFKFTKSGARGVLARLYLYQGKYKEALECADSVLAKNDFLLDLSTCQVVDYHGFIGRTDVPSKDDNKENVLIRLSPYVYGLSDEVFGSDELMALFTANDMRRQLFFGDSIYSTVFEKPLWRPWFEQNLGVTTPEMYLIAAECEARVGSVGRAMNLLNKLRDNRIVGNTPLVAANKDEALKLVLDERRREFALTGLTRFIDLKRLNLDSRFAKTITHVVDGKVLTLPPNDPRWALPIPARPLRFNKDMVPNPR